METAWTSTPSYGFRQFVRNLLIKLDKICQPTSSPFFTKHRQTLLELLSTHHLPAICEMRMYVVEGCLMTYGASLEAMFRRAAYYVDRILKGATPADLPVEQPMKFELVINLKTAQALGLTIPPTLLFQADEVLR